MITKLLNEVNENIETLNNLVQDKEYFEKLDERIEKVNNYVQEQKQEIERLTKRLEEAQLGYLAVEEKNKKLHSIIKEVREILKFHLSNPSGTKNGWHIDIWNSEDISKLNEDLGILDKENICTNCGQENE